MPWLFFSCSLSCLCPSRLWFGMVSLRPLWLANGTYTGNNGLTEVSAISIPGCVVGDCLIDSVWVSSGSAQFSTVSSESAIWLPPLILNHNKVRAYLRFEVVVSQATVLRFRAGSCDLLEVLEIITTPPFSVGWTPMAWGTNEILPDD
jgi:hypothetical protein